MHAIIGFFSAIWSFSEDPVLMRAQMSALKRQLPLCYLLLGSNVLALAFTHYHVAPNLLIFCAPGVLLPICIHRTFVWSRLDVNALDDEALRRRLKSAVATTGLLGSCFTTWSLLLAPYGDAFMQAHVAFFMSVTVIGCIACLMQLQPAALLLTVTVTVPFLVTFLLSGNVVLMAIALNFGLVAIVMNVLLANYFKEFRDLISSRAHLAALSDENFRMANLDSLTGLANRRSFFRDLQEMIESAKEQDRCFTLGLVDLDGFKPINDVYGHTAGDLVLREVAHRLVTVLGPTTKLARLGGDEYAFVLPGRVDEGGLRANGQAISAVLQKPIHLPTGRAQIAASIGFAAFPDMGDTLEQLIERADYALYFAKDHHRGSAVIFTGRHEDAIRARSSIEQELRRADLDAELTLQYQPIYDVSVDRVVAFEALARWTHPRLGRVPPAEFILAAERIGLITAVTETLLKKACTAMRNWPDDIGLSFNLSVHDIASQAAVVRIGDIIEDSGIDPARISLEITETALMRDFDMARSALLALKATGLQISLDDFGTGYSSLGYVHRLPIDKIKVDRSFMAGLTTEKASRDIVKTIVDLCRNLNLVCIVEGVETAEHVLILRGLGCRAMQGFYFSRPLDENVIATVMGPVALPLTRQDDVSRAVPLGAPPELRHVG